MEQVFIADDIAAYYRQKARNAVIEEILGGTTQVSDHVLSDLHIDSDTYQVIICESYNYAVQDMHYRFADMLHLANQDNQFFDSITLEQREVFLLKGTYAIGKFDAILQQYEQEKVVQKWSPLDTFFISYGRYVHTTNDIPLSFQDACTLSDRRFFCSRGQHILGYEELFRPHPAGAVMDAALLLEYSSSLTNYIQTFSRSGISAALNELQKKLCEVSEPIDSIRLFLVDLYLNIKEKMRHLYPNAPIPYTGNTDMIRLIQSKHYLYEILQFFTEQFETMISATGHSSRESVLDDILHYINHNYADNITLENIAPLFGYNSSYLGRIFSQKMGETFNSYVDHVRIDHSKELLRQEDSRIYTIAERVGYRNADYFHIKFKKYVGMSPAEYRKRSRS
ncbi:MAG: helix-turn-helix domain-containing protein [Acetatifactor sp.]|nr:helix-turn-helix domain-containing protein [Acetatifactor sp.]